MLSSRVQLINKSVKTGLFNGFTVAVRDGISGLINGFIRDRKISCRICESVIPSSEEMLSLSESLIHTNTLIISFVCGDCGKYIQEGIDKAKSGGKKKKIAATAR